MNPKDYLAGIQDALSVRAGVMNLNAAHPAAADFGQVNLLMTLAEHFGQSAARPGSTLPTAVLAAGIGSSEFRTAIADTVRAVIVARLNGTSRHRKFCQARQVPNFKEVTFASVDIDVDLEEVPENGAYSETALLSAGPGVSKQVRSFGRNVSISRTVIRNDDIGFISGVAANAGASAARLEARLVYGLLESNPVMGDGELMFHSGFGNVLPSALNASSLGVAIGRLRSMKTPNNSLTNNDAAYLVVSSESELTARTILHDAGMQETITVIATPWIAAGNWYLFAEPSISPVVCLMHLTNTSLTVGRAKSTLKGFDGISIGVRFDVGVAPVGRVGAVKGYV